MNLLERLKPEYKTELDSENVKFPSLVGHIVDALEKHYFIKNVPYGVIIDLKFLLKTPVSPYELFEEILYDL